MKNSGVEWIGEIPEDWEAIRLKYIYSTTKAKLPKQFYDDKSLTPYLSMDFIRDSINTEPVYAKDGDYCSEEDILILWDGSNAGEIVFNHPAGYAPSTTAILKKLSTQSLPVYDKFYLKSLEDDLRRNTNGMGIPHVNGSYLNNSLFLLPPKSTQQRIASYLDKKCSKIEETIQNQQQVIEKLKAYKQSLITEAVTGKIKIQNGKVCGKYESYKDSGVEWIGKIPSEWILSKFKFISKEIGDGLHGTPTFDESGDIYFLNGTNIGKEKLFFKDDTDRINSLEYEKYKHPLLSKYTIFIALNGATYGKTSFYNNEKVLLGKSAGYITFDKKQNILFLRYYLQSYAAKKIEEISLLGSTIQNLSLYTLNNFSVPLPSEIEQNSIVEYLDKKCSAIDTAIEQKQKLIEKLTEYKKSLIYECVTGKRIV